MNVLRRVPLGPARFNTVLIIAGGSILDYVGDAFVNAANEGCTGGFGVDEQVLAQYYFAMDLIEDGVGEQERWIPLEGGEKSARWMPNWRSESN